VGEGLGVRAVPESFRLVIETWLNPKQNTRLMRNNIVSQRFFNITYMAIVTDNDRVLP
jgi:hypothetical protein